MNDSNYNNHKLNEFSRNFSAAGYSMLAGIFNGKYNYLLDSIVNSGNLLFSH